MLIRARAIIATLIAVISVFAGHLNAQTSVSTPMEENFFWANTSPAGSGTRDYSKAIQDSCGVLYGVSDHGGVEIDVLGWKDQSGQAVQLTPNGGLRDTSKLMGGIALDASGNLYVSSPQNYNIVKIPSSGNNCGPTSVTATTPLFTMADLGLTSNYYPGDIVIDVSGNIYAYFSNGSIYELTVGGSYLQVASSLASVPTQLAVDAAGALYYSDGTGTVYKIASPGPNGTAAALVSGLNTVFGLTFDKYGNLFLEDTNGQSGWAQPYSTIYEVPYLNGALQAGSTYSVEANLTGNMELTTSSVDGRTLLYTQDAWETVGIIPGPINLGTQAIGSTSTAQLVIGFNSSVTVSTLVFTGPKGAFSQGTEANYPWWTADSMSTCATGSYAAGSHCTLTVQFAPVALGVETGSVQLLDANGNQLANAVLYGTGIAPAITIDPGAVNSFGSGYTKPSGAAFDQTGNMFIADAGANTIWEMVPGSTTPAALATGFNAPQAVAVDSAGNVYVADTGNNQIVEIPVVNGALSVLAQTTLISSSTALAGSVLNTPTGISIDAKGDLYIADQGNGRVLYIPYVGSLDPSLAIVTTTSLTAPSAVIADALGDVYVADQSSGNVYEYVGAGASTTPTTVATSLSKPTALALDASNSLFVVDSGNSKVWRIPNISGTLTQANAVCVSCQVNSSNVQVIAAPTGIALDSTGNLYVTDSTDAAVYQVTRTVTSQSAGTVAAGSTSTPMIYTVESAGTSALALSDPFYAASGNTSEFTILTSEANSCAASANVAVGGFCYLEAEYTPDTNAFGAKDEILTLSSNATNASTVTAGFSGTSPETGTPTTTSISPATTPTTIAYGTALNYSVTVTASSGTAAGAVDLYVDGGIAQSATLNSGGTASLTLAGGALAMGSHTIYAYFEGSQTQQTSQSVPLTVNVTAASTVTNLAFTPLYNNPSSQPAGTPMLLTATVTSNGTLQPSSGSVTFNITKNGTTAYQTVQLTSNTAVYSYTPSAPATAETYDTVTISATFNPPSTNYGASTSTVSPSVYVAPAVGLLVTSLSGTSLTSSSSAQSSVTFTHVSYSFNGTVSYSCDQTTLPANAECVFTPSGTATILASTSSSPQTPPVVALKVAIDNASVSASKLSPLFAGFSALLIFLMRRRVQGAWKNAALLLALALACLGVLGMTACSNTAASHLTPGGQYTVTVYEQTTPYTSGTTTPQACSSATTPCTEQVSTLTLTVNPN